MTIKINTATHEPIVFYKRATTPALRALLGFIIKSGKTNNEIYGGAFNLLRSIEKCMDNGEIYELYPLVDSKTRREIIGIAQEALDGHYDKFAIPERERTNTIQHLQETF